MQLLRGQFVLRDAVNQLFFFPEATKTLDQSDCFLVVVLHDARTDQVHNGQSQPKQCDFANIQEIVPKLQSSFETEGSAKDGKEPFDQECLGVDILSSEVQSYILVVLEEQIIKGLSQGLYEVSLKGEQPLEEGIGKDHIGEDIECFYLSNDDGQYDNGVSHSLDVADIRSIEMEQLKNLCDFLSQPDLGLILRSARKRPANVFANLTFDLFRHPILVSPLQQFEIKLISQGHLIVYNNRPNNMTKFMRNPLLNKWQSFLFELGSSDRSHCFHCLQPFF